MNDAETQVVLDRDSLPLATDKCDITCDLWGKSLHEGGRRVMVWSRDEMMHSRYLA
jgi:hypothetical protein